MSGWVPLHFLCFSFNKKMMFKSDFISVGFETSYLSREKVPDNSGQPFPMCWVLNPANTTFTLHKHIIKLQDQLYHSRLEFWIWIRTRIPWHGGHIFTGKQINQGLSMRAKLSKQFSVWLVCAQFITVTFCTYCTILEQLIRKKIFFKKLFLLWLPSKY